MKLIYKKAIWVMDTNDKLQLAYFLNVYLGSFSNNYICILKKNYSHPPVHAGFNWQEDVDYCTQVFINNLVY